MPRNGLIIVIDGLRYDTVADPDARRFLFPNLARLADRGFVRRLITNAQSTQFVMPALFTQTYPLDYGGYHDGIVHRPKSYIEVLADAGYDTQLFSSCSQLGVSLGYDRGFTNVRTTTDYRLILEQRLTRAIHYHLNLMAKGLQTRAVTRDAVQADFGALLDGIQRDIAAQDKSIWPRTLRRLNEHVAAGAEAEAALLARDPEAVLRKIERIPPGAYWRFLGRDHVGTVELTLRRIIPGLIWRSRRWLVRRRFPPMLLLTHWPSIASEVIKPLVRYIREPRNKPWHVHMHVMDVHDCRAINRPLHRLSRARYLPRWLVGRLRGLTRRHWVYDTALMYVDSQLGALCRELEESGQAENTAIVVTGDHGDNFSRSPRPRQEVGLRTYREDIEVPLLVSGVDATRATSPSCLYDSMSVSATLLDALNVAPHESFRGESGFRSGKPVVISESCGTGAADVVRRDLYFTITAERHKLMAVLKGSAVHVLKFFDLVADPDELEDLSNTPGAREEIDILVAHIAEQRAEIFEMRGVNLSSDGWIREAA